MWRLLSRPLEILARVRLRLPWSFRTKLKVGDSTAVDARGSMDWRHYLRGHQLFDVWGPVAGSPWEAYHCVPLFAALDRVSRKDVGPAPPPSPGAGAPSNGGLVLPRHARPGAMPPEWVSPGTWTILDLPGPSSVEVGAWLVSAAGCQPVCTFDNWPHPKGVLRPERVLAQLLRWASTVAEARPMLRADSPPLWICDADRLGRAAGRPGEFDNRYYLDDSILPGPAYLRTAGVGRIVYVAAGVQDVPTIDLESYFHELLAAGMQVQHVDLADESLEPRRYVAPTTPRRPPRSGFRRSAAGGFGTDVPEPSSGSSGG